MVWTAASPASGSTAASGSCARIARYFGTLLITVPRRARMRAKTAGVTSARMSTVTSLGSATASAASGNCALPPASRSCELTFRWAGVRCAFSASSASICRTALSGNLPPACADVCCAPTGPASSAIASTAPSNTQNGLTVRILAASGASVRAPDGILIGCSCVAASSAARIDWIALSVTSFSTAASRRRVH